MSLVKDALTKFGASGVSQRSDTGYGPPVSDEFRMSPNLREDTRKPPKPKPKLDVENKDTTVLEALQEVITGKKGLVSEKNRRLAQNELRQQPRSFKRPGKAPTPGSPGSP